MQEIANTGIEIGSSVPFLTNRNCAELGSHETAFTIWTSPSLVGAYYIGADAPRTPYNGLNAVLNFISNQNNTLGERETACEGALAYCNQAYQAANDRAVYILTIKGQQGNCCGFLGLSQCYGNQGQEACCWSDTQFQSFLSNAIMLRDAIGEWKQQFENQLDLLNQYQNDELSDAEYQAQVNLQINEVNEAVARTKALQEQVKLTEFLSGAARYVIPVIILVVAFFGWNALTGKK